MTLLPRVVKSEVFWIPLELSAMKGLGATCRRPHCHGLDQSRTLHGQEMLKDVGCSGGDVANGISGKGEALVGAVNEGRWVGS